MAFWSKKPVEEETKLEDDEALEFPFWVLWQDEEPSQMPMYIMLGVVIVLDIIKLFRH